MPANAIRINDTAIRINGGVSHCTYLELGENELLLPCFYARNALCDSAI